MNSFPHRRDVGGANLSAEVSVMDHLVGAHSLLGRGIVSARNLLIIRSVAD
jgi:hypothetical protein